MPSGAKRDLTIGLVATFAGNDYVMSLVEGVAHEIFARGGRVLCLAAGNPEGNNPLYRLIGPAAVDGLVFATGMITYHFTPQGLAEFLYAYRPLPIASIAVPIPDVPCALVDNAPGTRDAVRHLVEVHGKRRIAFAEGDPLNPEMSERRAGYEQGLRDCGIPFDRSLVVEWGDRNGRPWPDVARMLLHERKVTVDAIVAAGDPFALGVIEGLVQCGVDVPDDVAVIGFDDDTQSEFYSPSLASVHQPLVEQGRTAARAVLQALDGHPTTESTRLPVTLVTRRSCGCMLSRTALGQAMDDSALAALRKNAGDPKAYLAALDRVIRKGVREGADPRSFQEVVTAAQQMVGAAPAGGWDEARALAAEAAWGVFALRHEREIVRSRAFGEMSSALINAPDWSAVGAILSRELPRMNVRSVYVVAYTDRKHPESGARLMLSCEEDGLVRVEPDETFDTRELLPPQCARHPDTRLYVITPLSSRGIAFGYIVFGGEVGVRGAYEDLRVELGSLLDRIEREREVARLHRQEHQRARELQAAYQKLSENKERLVLSEKMASLGRLTAGIAHEMNTPIAAVRTALDEIGKLTDEYQASVGSPEVTAQDHLQIAREIREFVQSATSASERIASFVRGIRAQTRELPGHESLRFDLVPAVREALLLVEHLAREVDCTITFVCAAEHVDLTGDPAKVGPIVRNLVANAIEASAAGGGGPVQVELVSGETDLELAVVDRGEGIAKENLHRVFDPMFTTRGFGNHAGLGLTIVHDLVKSAFAGTVEVESEPGKGARFTVRLPKNRPISVPPP